jgi:hypothetical protein
MTGAQRTRLWLATNACAVLLYLYFASRVWPPAEWRKLNWAERHGPGDDIIWGLTAFPTLLVATILNLAVLGWVAWNRRRAGRSGITAWAWCIPALWLLAIVVDRYRQ